MDSVPLWAFLVASIGGPVLGAAFALLGVILNQRLGEKERRGASNRQFEQEHLVWLRERRYEACSRVMNCFARVVSAIPGDPFLALKELDRTKEAINQAKLICRLQFIKDLSYACKKMEAFLIEFAQTRDQECLEQMKGLVAFFLAIMNIENRGSELVDDPLFKRLDADGGGSDEDDAASPRA